MIKRTKKISNSEDEPTSLVSQGVKSGKYRKNPSHFAGKVGKGYKFSKSVGSRRQYYS